MSALVVGLMSGTSLDGVDAALVSFDGDAPRCLATHFRPYSDDLRSETLSLQNPGHDELRRSLRLANRLADLYAETTNELLALATTCASEVAAIGCHGQTLLHAPAEGYSLQLNNPARLVEKTGIAVVSDFRNRDIAAGGQGAPLVPAFHDAVFRVPDRHRVIANIGGISNLTSLAPGKPTKGFDCGPGNMLLDAWIARHQGNTYDAGGRWASQGKLLPDLLTRLLQHPFLDMEPPKSCGRSEFGTAWLDTLLETGQPAVDVQATLLAFTAQTLSNAVARWCGEASELYVCGGGAHNDALMRYITTALPSATINTTDALGLPGDWVEAIAFAWLAWRTTQGKPSNVPEATGARGPRVLGAIYPV